MVVDDGCDTDVSSEADNNDAGGGEELMASQELMVDVVVDENIFCFFLFRPLFLFRVPSGCV